MTVKTLDTSTTVAIDTRRWSAFATVTLGIALLFVVGFLQIPAVHNGAHDTRHANGFPCH